MCRYYYKLIGLLAAGLVLPQFLLRCDKAALNFQRGFFQGLGDSISDLLLDPLSAASG